MPPDLLGAFLRVHKEREGQVTPNQGLLTLKLSPLLILGSQMVLLLWREG